VNVHTRPATLDDDRALAVLDAQAWPPELWVVPPQDADEPFFGPRREPADVIVATLDGAVVGYARIGRHMPIAANDHVLHLEALAVSPAARGQGVGSLLIDVTIAEAFSRGARKLGLRALSTNAPAIRLYERAGFREEGRLKDEIRLPDGSYADDVWLALPLT
jgi:ribosomal protein S18 acetylase RimI-like enzyme